MICRTGAEPQRRDVVVVGRSAQKTSVAEQLLERCPHIGVLARTTTKVTDTFDFSGTGSVKDGLKFYERMGFVKGNATGIETTSAWFACRHQAFLRKRGHDSAISTDQTRSDEAPSARGGRRPRLEQVPLVGAHPAMKPD